MINPLGLAIAELRRHRIGAFAVSLLVALAVAFGVAVGATERAFREASARASDQFDLVVGAAGSPAQLVLTTVFLQPAPLELLPIDCLSKLRADPGVVWAEPVAFGDYAGDHAVVGTTSTFLTQGGQRSVTQGRMFDGDHEAVVGARVPVSIGASIRTHHGTAADQVVVPAGHEDAFRIVGRMPATGTPWDDAILVSFDDLARVHRQAQPGAPAIVVKPRSVADAYRLRSAWRRDGTLAVFPAEVLLRIHALLGQVMDAVGVLVALSQALVAGALLLVMILVVEARRASTAALRALGAPASYVLCVAWLQGFVLMAAGCLGGLALGWLLAAGLGRVVLTRTGLAVVPVAGMPELQQILALLIAASVLCVIPAFAALRGNTARELQA